MTKQEKIREGLAKFACECCEPADRGCIETNGCCASATLMIDNILVYLRDNDVVVRVDRELPGCGCVICDAENGVCMQLVEPLIGEK